MLPVTDQLTRHGTLSNWMTDFFQLAGPSSRQMATVLS